jgi:hypothetical protein
MCIHICIAWSTSAVRICNGDSTIAYTKHAYCCLSKRLAYTSHLCGQATGVTLVPKLIWSMLGTHNSWNFTRVVFNGSSITSEAFAKVLLQLCVPNEHKWLVGPIVMSLAVPLMVQKWPYLNHAATMGCVFEVVYHTISNCNARCLSWSEGIRLHTYCDVHASARSVVHHDHYVLLHIAMYCSSLHKRRVASCRRTCSYHTYSHYWLSTFLKCAYRYHDSSKHTCTVCSYTSIYCWW